MNHALTIPTVKAPGRTSHRFWMKVAIGEPNECWPWKESVNADGYGLYHPYGSKRAVRANRFALEQFHGPLGDLLALHTCDNPRCCNPKHLYAGTSLDNARDAVERHRLKDQSGEANGNAKLSASDVEAIKSRIAQGDTNTSIGRDYNLHHSTISKIRRGKSWA